jgi:hypothetical protein
MFAGFFPRLADLFLWIARPNLFLNPFGGNWFWPLLGIIFLPFTTLFYVLLWSPAVGIVGWDWLWIILAVLMDLGSLAGHYANYRDRLPGYAGETQPV